jgi:hypothetical protein
MEKEILEPYWSSNLKNQVVCKFRYPDGNVVIASVSQTDGGNPDWDAIFEKFSREQIDIATEERVKRHEQAKLSRQMDEQRRIDNMRREVLFMAKSDAFEVDLVRTSKNTALKSKLRKAATVTEVTLLSSIIAMENYNEQKAAEAAAAQSAENANTESVDTESANTESANTA